MYFLEFDYDFKFYPLQPNNIFQIVLSAKLRERQTKFELLHARKCQNSIKTN